MLSAIVVSSILFVVSDHVTLLHVTRAINGEPALSCDTLPEELWLRYPKCYEAFITDEDRAEAARLFGTPNKGL